MLVIVSNLRTPAISVTQGEVLAVVLAGDSSNTTNTWYGQTGNPYPTAKGSAAIGVQVTPPQLDLVRFARNQRRSGVRTLVDAVPEPATAMLLAVVGVVVGEGKRRLLTSRGSDSCS